MKRENGARTFAPTKSPEARTPRYFPKRASPAESVKERASRYVSELAVIGRRHVHHAILQHPSEVPRPWQNAALNVRDLPVVRLREEGSEGARTNSQDLDNFVVGAADVDADVVAHPDFSRGGDLRGVDARHGSAQRGGRRAAVGRDLDRAIHARLKSDSDDVARDGAINEVTREADHRSQARGNVCGINRASLLDARTAVVHQQIVPEVRVVLPPDGLLAGRNVRRADVVEELRFEVAEGDRLGRGAGPARAHEVDVGLVGEGWPTSSSSRDSASRSWSENSKLPLRRLPRGSSAGLRRCPPRRW